ncbi:MAG: hypothetical protein WCT49_00970 [Candidatus Paceibacterota bacterium]|jgi:hypothetical protein|nr:hypothetical protein [Candidatus Paceibacterota bacterium]
MRTKLYITPFVADSLERQPWMKFHRFAEFLTKKEKTKKEFTFSVKKEQFLSSRSKRIRAGPLLRRGYAGQALSPIGGYAGQALSKTLSTTK